jgi:hypothetical protein
MEQQGIDHEIIIVEQNDQKKFRRANLLNEGAKVATGDILILHDIDYYPTDNVVYYDGKSDMWLPVKRVVFVDEKFNEKNIMDVPGGYRHFKQSVDDNFFGGVEVFTRDAFFKINGFSPLFIGWGFEDADLRERVQHYNLTVARSTDGLFNALPHPDSGPSQYDQDFRRNIEMAAHWQFYLPHGIDTQPSTVEVINNPAWPAEVDIWVKATDFDGAPAKTHIVSSVFNFDEGDE